METHELSAAQAAELWPMMHNAMHRIPALEQAQVKMLVNGPERFTPDGAFLLGEAPEVKGFYVGCGMNSVGVASGGGAGRALAEWIVDGAPARDLWSVDIRRFASFYANERILRERIPEELGLHYAIGYPGRGAQDMIAGGGFEVELATERHSITVSLSPFFDPSGTRMRTSP